MFFTAVLLDGKQMVFRKERESCDSELLRDLPEMTKLVSSSVPAQNQVTAAFPSTFAVGSGDGQRVSRLLTRNHF